MFRDRQSTRLRQCIGMAFTDLIAKANVWNGSEEILPLPTARPPPGRCSHSTGLPGSWGERTLSRRLVGHRVPHSRWTAPGVAEHANLLHPQPGQDTEQGSKRDEQPAVHPPLSLHRVAVYVHSCRHCTQRGVPMTTNGMSAIVDPLTVLQLVANDDKECNRSAKSVDNDAAIHNGLYNGSTSPTHHIFVCACLLGLSKVC